MPQLVETRKKPRVQIRYASEGYDSGGGYHPRGAVYNVDTVEQAREVHPDATIDSVVTFDSVGQPVPTAYTPAVARAAGVMLPATPKEAKAAKADEKPGDGEFAPADSSLTVEFKPADDKTKKA